MRDAGIVHKDVKRAKMLLRCRRDGRHRSRIGHIRTAGFRADFGGNSCRGILVDIHHEDARALPGKAPCDAGSEAGSATRDQRCLSVKSSRHHLLLSAVIFLPSGLATILAEFAAAPQQARAYSHVPARPSHPPSAHARRFRRPSSPSPGR